MRRSLGSLETSNTSTVSSARASGTGTLAQDDERSGRGRGGNVQHPVRERERDCQLKATDGTLASALSLDLGGVVDPPPAAVFAQSGGGLLDLDGSGDLVA